jgi:hypothetical protein
MEMAHEYGQRYSADELNAASVRYAERQSEREKWRNDEAAGVVDITSDVCSQCGTHKSEASLYPCDHVGCNVANCADCSGWDEEVLEDGNEEYFCSEHAE